MTIEALGLWNLGKCDFHERLDTTKAKRIIKKAYQKGIRVFDSAYSYQDADTILYSVLKEMNAKREDWKIIEKIMSLPSFEKKAHTILKRLHSDYIDILLIHWPSEEESLYKTLKTLTKLKDENIAYKIGVSNFPLNLLKKASSDFPIEYHERPLSLVWNRDYEEEKLLNIKTLAYAPLGFGVLIEKEKPRLSSLFPANTLTSLKEELKRIAYDNASPIESVALSWVEKENPHMIVRGVSKEEQLFIPPYKIKDDEYIALKERADAVTSSIRSDNIFSHNWNKQ